MKFEDLTGTTMCITGHSAVIFDCTNESTNVIQMKFSAQSGALITC